MCIRDRPMGPWTANSWPWTLVCLGYYCLEQIGLPWIHHNYHCTSCSFSFSFFLFPWPCIPHERRVINTPSNQIVRDFCQIYMKLSLECSFPLKFSLASTNLAVYCGVLKSLDSSLVMWLYPLKVKGPKDKLDGVTVSKWDLSLLVSNCDF